MRLAALVLACTTTACSFVTVQKPRGVTPAGQVLLAGAIFFPSARYGFRHTARCRRLRDAVRDARIDAQAAVPGR